MKESLLEKDKLENLEFLRKIVPEIIEQNSKNYQNLQEILNFKNPALFKIEIDKLKELNLKEVEII